MHKRANSADGFFKFILSEGIAQKCEIAYLPKCQK